MRILIETTERYNKSVRLVDGEKIIAEKVGDIDMVSSIKEILDENNLTPKDIEEYVSNPGPGPSFTGIKIGVTIANVMNWALGKRKVEDLQKPEYGREPNITKRKKPL